MKISSPLIILIFLLSACSSPKKTEAPVEKPATVSKEDRLKGGYSYSNAVVIRVANESAGKEEEYRWLKNLYPGYSVVKKSTVKRSGKTYDIIQIRTADGRLKNIYFDISSFAGKK